MGEQCHPCEFEDIATTRRPKRAAQRRVRTNSSIPHGRGMEAARRQHGGGMEAARIRRCRNALLLRKRHRRPFFDFVQRAD